jgi:hypothetical protein
MKALPVGGRLNVPVGRMTYSSVRNCAALLGFELERKYSVHLDRVARCYEVTRNV